MKKVIISSIALSTLFTGANVTNASTDVTKIKPEHRYVATLTKAVKAYDAEKNDIRIYKKGQKVIIDNVKDYEGYDFVILKGNHYVVMDKGAFKGLKRVKGGKDYDKYVITKHAKALLSSASKKTDYQLYKAYVDMQDRRFFNFNVKDDDYNALALLNKVGGDHTDIGMNPAPSYAKWTKLGKPEAYLENLNETDPCIANKEIKAIDILSDTFIKEYIQTNKRDIFNVAIGDSIHKAMDQIPTCRGLGTTFGYAHAGSNAGYIVDAKQNVKQLLVTPRRQVTGKQVRAAYGEPTSVYQRTSKRLEYIMTYDNVKGDGYKVIVALDKHKNGQVKYITKKSEL